MVFESRQSVAVGISKATFGAKDVRVFTGAALPTADQCSIEQGLGDAIGATVSPSHKPHGGIGVASEPGLEEWRIEACDRV
jgi:hypothetical protein